MNELLYKEECFALVGCCMEVHRELGKGYSEVIYKDALQVEFGRRQIAFSREKNYSVTYKGTVLPHNYFADFVIMDKIILEIKAIGCLTSADVRQTLNYLSASKLKLGLVVNFGEDSLAYKRVIL